MFSIAANKFVIILLFWFGHKISNKSYNKFVLKKIAKLLMLLYFGKFVLTKFDIILL